MSLKYYVNDIPTNNKKMPFKKCNDAVKKAFFPAEDILQYVENFNERHFGNNIDKVEYIDQALDNHLIQNTPYWFISILQTVNIDCLSHTITILNNYFTKTGSNSSLCHLIFGMRRYVSIINEIEPSTVDPKERRMREEYSQYLLTFKDIVKSLQDLLNDSQSMKVIDRELEEALSSILTGIQIKLESRKSIHNSRSSRDLPAKDFDSLGKNSDKEAREFSFKASSHPSDSKRLSQSSQNHSEKSHKKSLPKEESKYDYDSEESLIETSTKKNDNFESRRPRRSKEGMKPPTSFNRAVPPKRF